YEVGFPASARRCGRDGNPATTGPDIDFAAPKGRQVFNEALEKFMVRLHLDGIYNDILIGIGFQACYKPGIKLHTYHGGNYCTSAVRGFLQEQRALVRRSAFAGRATDKPVLLSEGNEEFLVGLSELGQEGYSWHPWHTALMEWVVYDGVGLLPDLTLDDYPRAQRNMAPPIWDCVYHEYQASDHFSIMPTNACLTTSPFATGGFPGMTPTQMIDLHCCLKAGSFVSGMSPGFFDFNAGFVGSQL